MTSSILHRLEVLERKKPGTLIAQCHHIETGEVRTMPLREMIRDFSSWELDHIVSGNDLQDLDAYLGAFHKEVNRIEEAKYCVPSGGLDC